MNAVNKGILMDVTEATRIMTDYFLRGAVARIFEPGCDFGYCLVFAGNKAAARDIFRGLFREWFYDRTVNLRDPRLNNQMVSAGTQAANIAGGMADYAIRLKSITDTHITVWRGKSITLPRQFVTCATEITPMMRPLITDPHFWVIGLRDDVKAPPMTDTERDQIWGEARAMYESGTRYLPNEQEEALFQEQKLRVLKRLGMDNQR